MFKNIIYVAACLLPLCQITISNADNRADEPYGSRYLNYTTSELWNSKYGSNSDPAWPTSQYLKLIEDVNGDGMADVVAFGGPGTYVSLSNGTSFGSAVKAISNFGTNQNWSVDSNPRFVVDINGDGNKDLVGYGSQGVYGAVYNGTDTNPSFGDFKKWLNDFGSLQHNNFYANDLFIRTMADMNNDQMSDLVVFADDGILVALSNGNGFDDPTLWVPNFGTEQGWTDPDYIREIADMNGDGFLDVVGYGRAKVYVSLNDNGSGLHNAEEWTNQYSANYQNGFYTNSDFIRTTGDADGDGNTDLIVFADDGVYAALSTGEEFAPGKKWISAYGTDNSAGNWNNNDYERVIADVNSDGMADIVGFYSTGTYFSMSKGEGHFANSHQWVTDFGYDQDWHDGEHPRYMRDVNGDGILDITGYGNYGVYVSASSPLYCCDRTYFYDSVSQEHVRLGYMARLHLPTGYDKIVMPTLDPSTCPPQSGYPNQYRAIGPNSGRGNQPWVNSSWLTELGARFAINANFFDASQKSSQYQCTKAYGLSVSGNELLSPDSQFKSHDTDALVIYKSSKVDELGKYADIVPGQNIQNSWTDNVQFAISGVRLITNGAAVASEPRANDSLARAAVGLTEDNKTLIFVIQNHGYNGSGPIDERSSLPGMADALLRLGAYNAINLDGSGSAQFWFKNNETDYKSLPSDSDGNYRAIPVVFGVK